MHDSISENIGSRFLGFGGVSVVQRRRRPTTPRRVSAKSPRVVGSGTAESVILDATPFDTEVYPKLLNVTFYGSADVNVKGCTGAPPEVVDVENSACTPFVYRLLPPTEKMTPGSPT